MSQPAAKRRCVADADTASDFSGFSEDVTVTRNADFISHDAQAGSVSTGALTRENESRNQAQVHNKAKSSFPSSTGISNALYKSNLFKLQMDELLGEVRTHNVSRLKRIDSLLRYVKELIEHIPDRAEVPVAEAENQLRGSHNIAIPFPNPRPSKDVKYGLLYAKPANINVVGSYALKTITKSNGHINIDMALTMPSKIFREKDYLNYRYFYKRAYFLACIAVGLQDQEECKFDVEYKYLNNNSLQPILSLVPLKMDDQAELTDLQCVINLLPVATEQVFPLSKSLPTMNCVRPARVLEEKGNHGLSPTPFYNASLRSDCSVTSYLKLLHGASVHCDAFKDACMLGRLWLRQRGMLSSVDGGGFGHFEWAALMAILLQCGGPKGHPWLLPGYSSYQLFKRMLEFLSNTPLVKSPLLFKAVDLSLPRTDMPVVFDGERGLNILFKMTPWSFEMLRMEAVTSLKMLNDSVFDYFEESFIIKVNQSLENFDIITRLPMLSLPAKSLDYESDDMRMSRKLFRVLAKGLGDRVSLIHVSGLGLSNWSITSSIPPNIKKPELAIRLRLDPANAWRTVDHGPPAELTKEATAFRQFWGEKAELRRFKDGRILESLNWAETAPEISVIQKIMLYLFERHIDPNISKSTIFSRDIAKQLLAARSLNDQQPLASFQPFTGEYENLEKAIRKLENLPLQIRQVFPADSTLRYAAVDPPLRSYQHTQADPMDVVLHFEGSGRWPDDLEAIQRTKIALLLKLAELLEQSIDGVVTRLGLENERYTTLNNAFLDVIFPSRLAFRVRIQNEREKTLNERRLKDKAIDGRSRDEAVLALAAYKRCFVQAPLHTQMVRILCTRYPMLSPTIRLMKKWFNSHLLSLHFSEEFIELVTIRTFVQPYPWQAPSSTTTGFLRTLRFLSRWDWRAEPLIVDTNAEMTSKDMETIQTRFEAWRKVDPGMLRVVLFAASNHDTEGITWTQNRPSKVVAARMTTLARAACAVVKESDLDLDPLLLFTSSTSDYDFIIHLHPRFAEGRRGEKEKQQEFKNLQNQSSKNIERIGYNPISLFIEELSRLYSSTFLLFYNTQEGSFIAGIWNPQTGPRPWKVNLTYSTRPVLASADGEKEPKLDINKTAILNEIARLGGDMVLRVETKG